MGVMLCGFGGHTNVLLADDFSEGFATAFGS
jgi:hypothetical protein